MKTYPSTNDDAFLDQVKRWINSDGEVYVNVGFWRASGANHHMLITSFDKFMSILPPLREKKGAITVLRHPVFKVRGIANQTLLKQAMTAFPIGVDWFLICPNDESPYDTIGLGDRTHTYMQELFQRVEGRLVAMGDDKDFPPDENRDDVLVAMFNLPVT